MADRSFSPGAFVLSSHFDHPQNVDHRKKKRVFRGRLHVHFAARLTHSHAAATFSACRAAAALIPVFSSQCLNVGGAYRAQCGWPGTSEHACEALFRHCRCCELRKRAGKWTERRGVMSYTIKTCFALPAEMGAAAAPPRGATRPCTQLCRFLISRLPTYQICSLY
jgi:hypothetical protein